MHYSTLTVKRVVGGKVNKFSKILNEFGIYSSDTEVSTFFLKIFTNYHTNMRTNVLIITKFFVMREKK